MIVATVPQDGQQQTVIDVAGVQLRRPRRQPEPHHGVEPLAPGTRVDIAIGFTPVHWRELLRRGRKGLPDLITAHATAEIAANSGVSPRLNASASMASSGQIQSSGLIDTGLDTIAAT
ncbi:hypothetical protein [Bradyrhizobium sp. WSM4349]|uniref:hypothetical protein n=1 Tax=Bradyrhizobium sp. WSM4349 TaxID=1040988 RepID=UPI0018DF4B04|nr:hypothetical protein [Bradyrhizobium sp. WSM4349]